MNTSLLPGFLSHLASKLLCTIGLALISVTAHAQQEAMHIDNIGNVSVSGKLGIGVSVEEPFTVYPLTVLSKVNYFSANNISETDGRKANSNLRDIITQQYIQNTSPTAFASAQVSIYAEGAMMTGKGYYQKSDRRIKKSFFVANTQADLRLLNQFKPTSFQYRDSLACGKSFVKGFVAQEVEQLFPQAITTIQDCIPSIYALAQTCTLNQGILRVTLKNPHLLQTGDVVRLISKAAEKEEAVTVTSANSFTVAHWDGVVDKLFVYGKRVNDFKAVDYQQLFTLNISATQQLSKDVDELKAEVNALKAMNEALRATVVQLAGPQLPLEKQRDASPTASVTGK